MKYTKEELDFLKKNGFKENYPYGMLFNLDVTVNGDHAYDCAGIYYGKNKSGAMLEYYSSLLDMIIDHMSYADMTDNEVKKRKEDLLTDIQIWIEKLNKAAGTSFKTTHIDIPMSFFIGIEIKDVDFQSLCEKIRKFAVLMDKSLMAILEKVSETNSWDVRFSEAPIAEINDD